jgi:hypothetical protein
MTDRLDVVITTDEMALKVVVCVIDNAVGIGTAITKRVDADAPETMCRPVHELSRDGQIPFFHGYARVGLLVPDGRRDLALFEHHDGLD